jgi:hypothetical protein
MTADHCSAVEAIPSAEEIRTGRVRHCLNSPVRWEEAPAIPCCCGAAGCPQEWPARRVGFCGGPHRFEEGA